jgi:cell division septum initiation protein DivIVA
VYELSVRHAAAARELGGTGVALDRQSIEKRDFPVAEQGYDPEAVHAHLAALATEVEGLKRSSAGRTGSVASWVSQRVHAIIEAAEQSASDINRTAAEEVRATREQADADAHHTREQAATEARAYLVRVSEVTGSMMHRLDSAEQEFGALVEAMRTGSNRLRANVQQLDSDLARARESIIPPPGAAAPVTATTAEAGHEAAPAPGAAEFAEVVGKGETAPARATLPHLG